MAHFSVRQRSPFRKSFMPSRRQTRHLGPRSLATLDPPPLARAHAVVGLRRHVLHAEDLEPRGLERSDRRLASGARPLDEDLDLLEAVLHALASAGVGGHLGGERRRLAGALEAGRAGRLPRDDVSVLVRQRHDRVVERRLDVRLADRDVLADTTPRATAGRRPSRRSHLLCLHPSEAMGQTRPAENATAFFAAHFAAFLPRPTVFFGPLRVRAFVLVRWPLTGRPRRCRNPGYA